MTTAVKAMKPTKAGSTTFKNWKDVIFLVKEPTRKGTLAWFVRVVVGDLDRVRAGPYKTEKEARKEYAKIVEHFDDGIWKIMPTTNVNYEV